VAAHQDLGSGYDDAVAEGLVERIGAEIDKRIDARLGSLGTQYDRAGRAGAQVVQVPRPGIRVSGVHGADAAARLPDGAAAGATASVGQRNVATTVTPSGP